MRASSDVSMTMLVEATQSHPGVEACALTIAERWGDKQRMPIRCVCSNQCATKARHTCQLSMRQSSVVQGSRLHVIQARWLAPIGREPSM